MVSSPIPAVPDIAMRQGGIFTAEQARSEGWTARTVRRRIAARRWVYVAGRALAEPRPRWTSFQLAMAAQLSMRDIVISHRTAADLHGFPDQEPTDVMPDCDVIVRTRRPGGLRIRPHHLRLAENDTQPGPCGLQLTTPARTAVDCLTMLPFGPALDLWAWLATRRILDQQSLGAVIELRRHWHGTQQLRRLAEQVCDGAVSQAEFRLQELLRAAGLGGWTANAPVRDRDGLIGVVDLLFTEARVVVEVDGWRSHRSRASFIDDRRRQNRLVAAGYTVLRFTWDDLQHRPTQVITQIRRALVLER
jgi:very-short-patch-repair endonuclease